MPKVKIDGHEIEVPQGTSILQAAEMLGFEVPQMCYHPGLRVVGVCRVCLCEVKGMPKLTTACSTEVRDGMEVGLYTEKAEAARQGVIEFWLLNHPLDCPICDQGGECPLQDIAFDHGTGQSRLEVDKVHKEKRNVLGPTVVLDEERCILCWRCTRFTQEVSGSNQLMLHERGVHTAIGTPPDTEFTDPFSANVVDICPVGALTTRDFRFKSRIWEMGSADGICTECSVGCNMRTWSKKGVVERLTARPNLSVNDYWLCDRGRFSHKFINHPERLKRPLVRVGSELRETEWGDALKVVADALKPLVARGQDQVGALFSPHLSNEEYWAFQKFVRSQLGSNHLSVGRTETLTPTRASLLHRGRLLESIVQIEGSEAILVVGGDLEKTHPVYSLRVRKSVRDRGVKLALATPSPEHLDAEAAVVERVHANQAAQWLRALGRSMTAGSEEGIAGLLKGLQRVTVLVNAGDFNGQVAEALDEVLSGGGAVATWRPLFLDEGGNIAGAMALGISPHFFPGYKAITQDSAQVWKGKWGGRVSGNQGLEWGPMIQAAGAGKLRVMILVNSGRPAKWEFTAEEKAQLARAQFVVAFDMFSDEVAEFAHVVLPTPSFAEVEASYTTQDGLVQLGHRSIVPMTPTALQTLSRLAALVGAKIKGPAPQEVFRELARDVPGYGGLGYARLLEGGARGQAEGAGALAGRR